MPLTSERLDELELLLMIAQNMESVHTAFTVSVHALPNTVTVISAFDRVATVLTFINTKTRLHDIVTPGYLFPCDPK